METLAFIYAAVEYEDPHPAPELRSFDDLNLKLSSPLIAGTIAMAVVTATLGHAENAQALLRYGDKGPGVRQLQEQLTIVADGVYGNRTYQAVQAFQRRNGLYADGVAGPATLAALGLPAYLAASGSTGGGNVPISSSTYVTAAALNVRTYPAVNAPVRDVLYQGDRVELTGATRYANGYQWSQLRNGGWVASTYLSSGGDGGNVVVPVAGTAYVTASTGLLVRNAPAGTVIGSLGYGAPLSLTGGREYAAGRYWVQLTSGSWVAEEYITYRRAQLG